MSRAEQMERRLMVPTTLATLLVVPVLILQGAHVAEPWRTIAGIADWAIWLTFVAEVALMLNVVDDRRGWLARHPLDVAIVVVTPPFVSAAFQSIRALRLLRLLRLARIAQLARGLFSLEGLRYAALLALLTAIAGGEAFAEVENVRVRDGLYWAATTMTTVGYGDVTPKTETGRAIAVGVMLVGMGFVAVLTGAIAQRFIAPAEERVEAGGEHVIARLDDVTARLARIEAALTDRNGR